MNPMKFVRLLVLILFVIYSELVVAQSSKLDSLKNELPKLQGIELVKVNIAIATEMFYTDPVGAIAYCDKAIEIAKNGSFPLQEAEALVIKCGGMMISGQTEEGLILADSAIDLCKKLEAPMLICKALNAKAMYFFYRANFEEALKIYQEANEIATNNNFKELAAKIQVNLGSIHTEKGNYFKGIKAYKAALDYYEENENKRMTAMLYTNIGTNYSLWLPPSKAREYYAKAVSLYEEENDPVAEATTLNNIGDTYSEEENYSKAIDYYKNALEVLGNSTNSIFVAVFQVGLGEAYLKLNNIDRAKYFTNRALVLFNKNKHNEGIARAKTVLGGVKILEDDYQGANKLLDEAMEIADDCDIKDLKAELCAEFADLRLKEKNYKEALEYTKAHFEIKDSLLNKYKGQQLNEFMAQMEVSQKEAEIGLLQKDSAIKSLEIKRKSTQVLALIFAIVVLVILSSVVLYFQIQKKKTLELVEIQNQQISDQNDKLIVASEMQNKILSIIGHDLTSSVGGLKEMLSLVDDNPGSFTAEELLSIVPSMKDAVDDTYFLLANLLSWAKNQGGNYNVDIKSCKLSSIVNQNLSFLKNSILKKSIRVKSSIDDDVRIQFDENMLGMVVRNLISNAVKFTPRNGTIEIYTDTREDKILFCVKDTGIGISNENQKKLFSKEHVSTFGTDNEKGTGLGLGLCKEFITKNDSELMVHSKVNEGSLFCFVIDENVETNA
jgi:signal transduction histidine kinase